MAKETLEVTKGTFYKVPFTHLCVDPGLNFREDYGDIKELVESIRENGVQENLRGWIDAEGWHHVINGHRRFKAMEILYNEGVTDIRAPFTVIPKGTSEGNTIVQMFVANDGKPFTILEQAKGVERLKFYGMENAEIAQKLAKSVTHIANLLLLANAPIKFKRLIKKGIISATFAIDLIKQGEDAVNKAINDYAEQPGTDEEHGEVPTGKTAKVTKKQVSINSFSELKKFAKETTLTEYPTKQHETFFWLLQDIAANKIQAIDLVNFFTSGEYEKQTTAPKKSAKAKKQSETAGTTGDEPAEETKAAKKSSAKKEPTPKGSKRATKRAILYDKSKS